MNKTMNAEAAKLAGLQIDFLQKLRNGSRTLSEFELFLNGKNPFPNYVTPDEMKLTVTIIQSTIAEMVIAGNYDWDESNIVKNFQFDPTKIGTWEFDLVDKGHESSVKAKAFCEEDGWEAASLEHLLMIGASFPLLQTKNPIIALNSAFDLNGKFRVPALSGTGGHRGLDLYGWGSEWHRGHRFLSVRRVF